MEKIFDVLIVGGGVAGMSAALYAKRGGKSVAIVEKYSLGGTVLSLDKIQNFPSQVEIDGFSLAQMFTKQVEALEIDIIYDDIIGYDLLKENKILTGKMGKYCAKNIILAGGMDYVELGKNELEFIGKGVSFCAVCDANFYKNRVVCVISKNGSGIKDALYLSNIVDKVILLDSGDLSTYASANKNNKLEIVSKVEILQINGSKMVENVDVLIGDQKMTIGANGVFVCLGKKPKTDCLKDVLNLDEKGFVVTDEKMKTNIDGVYAVGDIRAGIMNQIVSACNDGAIAGRMVCDLD